MSKVNISKLRESEIAKRAKITSENVKVVSPSEEVAAAFRELNEKINGKTSENKKSDNKS